jgi:3-keto-disaccharide hydrolase
MLSSRIKYLLLSVLCAAAVSGCQTHKHAAKSVQWEVLFDGTSTYQWRGYRRNTFPDKAWTVENGTLKTIKGGETVDLVTKNQYQNFVLDLEWRISTNGNSGVMVRVTEDAEHAWQSGPEMQILDDEVQVGHENPKTSAGALYDLIAPVDKHLQPVGEWNHAGLIVDGNHVEYWLNGFRVVQYELNSDDLESLIAHSKFKDLPSFARAEKGYVALQNHKSEVWFRNIKIRRL